MFRVLLYLIANILIVLGLSNLLPGFEVSGVWAAAVFFFALTVLHWTIIPILKILTFPINFLSLGLLGLLINLGAVWLVATNIQGIALIGDATDKFITVILVSLGLSIGKAIIDHILRGGKESYED
jgi:putative membrane protein